eukprot:SAG22_NODE_3003_length_2034_cov_4.832558_2_plen_480_part_00
MQRARQHTARPTARAPPASHPLPPAPAAGINNKCRRAAPAPRRRDYMPHSAFMKNPLVVSRAQGLYYWDVGGKRYFDGIGGIFTVSVGHGHPAVNEAVRRQLDQMTFCPPMHGVADVTFEFIEKLSAVTPTGLDYVKTYSGASEAMESAIKFVRQYWKQSGQPGKYKFISRYLSYHGATMGAMSASGTGLRKTPFEPQMPGFLKVHPPTYYQDKLAAQGVGWEECNRFCAQTFEDTIISEDPSTVAGIIVEPIGNTGGLITPTVEYFDIVREICDRHNVMLIFDETITGFCKTGSMFCAQTYGVDPDLIVTGKGVSNGVVPLAAMIAQADMAGAFLKDDQSFFAHGHTFANNPLACAVGSAVLDIMVEEKMDLKAQRLGEVMSARLNAMKDKFGCIREVRGKGTLRGVTLVKPDGDGITPWPELGTEIKNTAIDNGLIMRIDPTWFTLCPALCAEEADIHELCDLVEKSVADALVVVKA